MIKKFGNWNISRETISKKDSEMWFRRKISGTPYFLLKNLRANAWEMN